MAGIPNIHPNTQTQVAAVTAVQAAIDNAVRLGLVWRLRPGTVAGDGLAAPESVPVVVDGDTAQVRARSMVGFLAGGQRVWCVQIPPAGVYVLGVMGEKSVGGRVRVRRLGDQPIPNSTNTIATFTDEIYDDHGYWNGSGTFTVPPGLGGLYAIACNAAFDSNATGSRAINILHSGTRVASVFVDTHSASTWREFNGAQLLLAEGDTVQMQVFQSSGGSLDLVGTNSSITTFSMARIQTE